jgi:DNA-binding GntR family transcriptional regulator
MEVEQMTNALAGIALDHASPVPLYHQAAQALEGAIEDGRLPQGTKLENELRLAERLGVSRPTMRAAIRELVDKGLLVRRRGVGTIVAPTPIRRTIALTSLYEDLKGANKRPSTRVLRFERRACPPEVRELLNAGAEMPVLIFDRLRLADSEPVALMHNVIPADLLDIAGEELERRSLYELLRENGVRLHVATQRVGAKRAGVEEAEVLGVEPGDPLLTMTRIVQDPSGRPVEYGWHRYPAQSHSFEMVLMEK